MLDIELNEFNYTTNFIITQSCIGDNFVNDFIPCFILASSQKIWYTSSMLEIKSVLDKFNDIKAPQSERATIVKQFVDRLSAERNAKPFYIKDGKRVSLKPISARTVAIRISYVKTSDLYYIYSICKDARSFSEMFWFMTRTKKLVAA